MRYIVLHTLTDPLVNSICSILSNLYKDITRPYKYIAILLMSFLYVFTRKRSIGGWTSKHLSWMKTLLTLMRMPAIREIIFSISQGYIIWDSVVTKRQAYNGGWYGWHNKFHDCDTHDVTNRWGWTWDLAYLPGFCKAIWYQCEVSLNVERWRWGANLNSR